MNDQSKQRIGFVGECMIELKQMSDGGIRQHYSGDVLNTAVFFKRELGQAPIDAEFITALGNDSLSANMLQFWCDENLNCDYVVRVDKKLPGLYFIQVNDQGERSFNYWRSDSAAKSMFTQAGSQRLLDHLQDLDGVYLSGITLAILNTEDRELLFSALAGLKQRGGKIYFDNNYRPALWSSPAHAVTEYERIMTQCDIAFLTADDEAALYGTYSAKDIFKRIEAFSIPEVVIKCGSGPCCIQVGQEALAVPAEKVAHVVDTTAAGDSFSAAYLAARLQRQSPLQSARAGHALAARVIQTEGVFEIKGKQ